MSPAKNNARLHIRLTGRVQGVGFRAFVAQQARDFPVSGWVRNVGANQVEVMVEGPRADLERFLACIRNGPDAAVVNDLRADWHEARGAFKRFRVRWW